MTCLHALCSLPVRVLFATKLSSDELRVLGRVLHFGCLIHEILFSFLFKYYIFHISYHNHHTSFFPVGGSLWCIHMRSWSLSTNDQKLQIFLHEFVRARWALVLLAKQVQHVVLFMWQFWVMFWMIIASNNRSTSSSHITTLTIYSVSLFLLCKDKFFSC